MGVGCLLRLLILVCGQRRRDGLTKVELPVVTVRGEAIRQNDPTALGADTTGGRLEQLDDTHSHPSIAEARDTVPDALGKVSHYPLQGFARLDVRAPDIAGTIVDE